MSSDASVTFAWADDTYRFALPLGQVRELEENRKTGARRILIKLRSGDEDFDDIREVIRLGLIGGGQKPTDALKLVKRYVDDRPRGENIVSAMLILSAHIIGNPDDPVGKAPAGEGKNKPPQTMSDSPSPQSTASEPQ